MFRRISVAMGAFALVCLVASFASADIMLDVTNPSFDYTTWASATPGTTHSNTLGFSQGANYTTAVDFSDMSGLGDDQATLLGWDTGAQSSGALTTETYPTSVGYANASYAGGGHWLRSAPIVDALGPDRVYTLTAQLMGTTAADADILFTLLNSASAIIPGGNLTITHGTGGNPGTLSYILPTDISTTPDDMRVFLRNTGASLTVGGSSGVLIDNVQLSYVAVPEPGTIALLATGLLGLLAYAWKKRR